MFLINLLTNPVMALIALLAIGLSIGVHEAAHAWTADKLGDSTAKHLGRTTINPLAHIDLYGLLFFLLVGFGWGKPVPVNEHRLRRPNDFILVALAGPLSNLVTAVVLALAYRLLPSASLHAVLAVFIYINLGLMLFNLIPIPPLDGSRLLRLIVPAENFAWFEQYGVFFLLAFFLIFSSTSVGLDRWLTTAVSSIASLLVGGPLTF